jgi:peptide/nickel transport system ATP-binding protein
MNTQLLSIQDLRLDFISDGNTSTAISEINIEVNRGEIVAIVGESGSGKSVTSLSILRLIPTPPANYVGGKILFTNKDGVTLDLLHTSQEKLRQIRGNEISMIFQEPMTSLNPVHTCGNQVAEALQLHQKISYKEAREKAIALFESVQLPKPAAIYHRYPHQLSGGQKQRVMIAMAISCKPSLLICDEPTTALDVTVQKTILQLVKDLQQQSMGVIFITHDLGVVAEIADRVVVMYKGKIVEQGLAKDIYLQPQHPYTKALLACRPALHPKGERLPVVSDFMGENSNEKSKIEESSSSEISNFEHVTPNPKLETTNYKLQTPLLSVQNVKVWFPGKHQLFAETPEPIKAVNDVSFDVYEGETVGLVGESGCGKTTLGRAILQLIKPTAGEITFKGKSLIHASREDMQLVRKQMQIIFQDPYSSLNPRMIIGKAIAEPLQVHGIGSSHQQRKEMVMELLEKVNLKAEHYRRYPHEFSGGQRQRIVIARALSLNPSFIICDESVSALDVSVQAQVLNLLNDLKKDFGFTAIFISHDLSVVRYISDRILVMNKGKIEETGDAEAIYHHPQSPYTKKLIDSIPKGLLAEH